MHEQFCRGTGDEGGDVAARDEGVGAEFRAGDELLRDPRVRFCRVDAGEGGICERGGGAWEKGHVAAVGVVHADGFHDVAR